MGNRCISVCKSDYQRRSIVYQIKNKIYYFEEFVLLLHFLEIKFHLLLTLFKAKSMGMFVNRETSNDIKITSSFSFLLLSLFTMLKLFLTLLRGIGILF